LRSEQAEIPAITAKRAIVHERVARPFGLLGALTWRRMRLREAYTDSENSW
jgi:hypothetical protein